MRYLRLHFHTTFQTAVIVLRSQAKTMSLPAFCFLLLFIFHACTSEPEVDVVARVGDLSIGKEEFRLSFEFNPYFLNISDSARAKKLLLITLIAEKMIVQESFSQKPGGLPSIDQLTEQYRREALIEKFWQKEIKEKIEITDQEIYQAYLQSKRTRYFRFLTFQSKESADRAYQHLINGLDFTEVAKLNGLDNRAIPMDSVSFGNELSALEEQVFQLPVNGVSEPFKLGQYYFIINFITEKTDIFTTEDDYNRQYKQLKKVILRRKQLKSLQDYLRERFSEPPYRLDRKNFKTLVQQIEKVVSFVGEANNPTRIFPYKEITGRLADILDNSAVSFDNGTKWTNRELLQRIKVAPYPIEFTSPGKFRSSMIAATKMILDDEVLVELAKQEKLDKTAYVRDQVRIWREYLLYQAMVAKIYRTFSNDQTPSDTNYTENSAVAFDKYLCSIADKYTLIINHSILDSLTLIKTDMAVIKQHFPARSLIPLIQPLYQPSAFGSIISGKIIQK